MSPLKKRFLLLTVGLPGVGKTTLVRHLVRLMDGVAVYESDVIRKRLVGYPPDRPLPRHLYNPEVHERTFTFIREGVRRDLRRGRSVIVDATFTRREYRRPFLDVGLETGTPTIGLHVFAPEEVVIKRLSSPRSVSDANYEVYRSMKETAELPPEEMFHISVDGTEDPVASALKVLTWIKGLLRVL